MRRTTFAMTTSMGRLPVKLAASLLFLAFLLYLSRRKPEIMQFDDDIDWLHGWRDVTPWERA